MVRMKIEPVKLLIVIFIYYSLWHGEINKFDESDNRRFDFHPHHYSFGPDKYERKMLYYPKQAENKVMNAVCQNAKYVFFVVLLEAKRAPQMQLKVCDKMQKWST